LELLRSSLFGCAGLLAHPRSAVPLTGLERDFLQRLSTEPWVSPPLFDHSIVVRLVEAGLVQTETLPTGAAVQYEITEAGRAVIADSNRSGS
jgi:hypothetical protein